MKMEFNVNQVREALEKRFKIKIIMIDEAYVASAEKQFNPGLREIGWGGVLTVVCEVK